MPQSLSLKGIDSFKSETKQIKLYKLENKKLIEIPNRFSLDFDECLYYISLEDFGVMEYLISIGETNWGFRRLREHLKAQFSILNPKNVFDLETFLRKNPNFVFKVVFVPLPNSTSETRKSLEKRKFS